MNAVARSLVVVATAVITAGGVRPRSAAASDVLAPVDFRQVRLGGEIGRRIDLTINNNLLRLNVEKDFLAPFFAKNGPIPGDELGDYIGLGKLIESAVRFAAYEKTDKLRAWKKRLIDETIRAQDADGYLGIMAPQLRVVRVWDACEMGYIILGLTADYQYFGEKRALQAARKIADYLVRRWSTPPADWPKLDLNSSIGLEYAMLVLYRETGDRRYLGFCIEKRLLPQWGPDVASRQGPPLTSHAYGYTGICLAQLALHHIQPSERLLAPTRQEIIFLTAQDGLMITGVTGQKEAFVATQDGRGACGETCATAYLIRLYDNLLRMEGDSRYGDLMERTIYNGLFAAQSRDGRRLRYFTPLEGPRSYFYSALDGSGRYRPCDTYCCPCNYRRVIAELPTMVYYRAGTGLAVNLYTPSEATVHLEGGPLLKVRQETDYPSGGRVLLRFDPAKPVSFPLQLRIPRWCWDATVTVNGRRLRSQITAGAFLTIERQWKSGDSVSLDMPMKWRLVQGRKAQAGFAAVMRGPLVFCLNPAQNDAIKSTPAADLKNITIDPASLKDLTGDSTARPEGMACLVEAKTGAPPKKLLLKLTEFPDPDGQCVYFRLPDSSHAVPDECTAATQ
jgi:uncharacterized protein